MSAPASIKFPSSVAPGQTIDINVDMTAPAAAGHYIGYWSSRMLPVFYLVLDITPIDHGGSRSFDQFGPQRHVVYDLLRARKMRPGPAGRADLPSPVKTVTPKALP